MPYIVKSSLDIGGKIVAWNEQETNKLIKEKEEYLKQKTESVAEPIQEEKEEKEVQAPVKTRRRNKKVGEENE